MYDGGHAITCWGFEYDSNYAPADPANYYEGIYVTDSDDYTNQLAYYPVSWSAANNWWDLGGGFSGWHLAEVTALEKKPIPEPCTILLLITGLGGMVAYGFRRKKTP
jgi:hypothetical protein